MNVLERLSQLSQSAVTTLRVRSALNPMLWLCAIMVPMFVTASWLFRWSSVLSILFAIAATLPVVVTLGVCIYFAVRRPEKLQSEDYQLRQETLRIIGDKATIQLDPSSLAEIATQTTRALPTTTERLD